MLKNVLSLILYNLSHHLIIHNISTLKTVGDSVSLCVKRMM